MSISKTILFTIKTFHYIFILYSRFVHSIPMKQSSVSLRTTCTVLY